MKLSTELEAIRTLSQLSEKPHAIEHAGRQYVAFTGYIVPHSTFCVLFTWAVLGSNLFHSIWKEQEHSYTDIINLNPQDKDLKASTKDYLPHYLSERFQRSIRSMDPDELEQLILQMYS